MAERPSPVHAYAAARGIEVRTPTSLKSAEEQAHFAALKADFLAATRLGFVNFHGSLLPALRGATPVEGSFRFTRSADGRSTYLISYGWPGPQVRSRVLRPAPGSKIMLLGWSDLLPWEQLGAVCVITTPREMGDEENHPCKQAFVFKVESPR